MAGPQIQRPQSAYYTGLNGSSNGHQNGNRGGAARGEGGALTTSTSHHTGLHTIRTISHDSELIYRGTNGNNHNLNNNTASASTSTIRDGCAASTSRSIIQQQPTLQHNAAASGAGAGGGGGSGSINLATIAGTGQNPNDALIVPAATLPVVSQHHTESANISSHSQKSSNSKCKQRSIEIIVDATKCDTKEDEEEEDDIEQGKSRRSSRHRHRPLHRRFLNYLKSLFQGSTTQTGKLFPLYIPHMKDPFDCFKGE